MSSQSVDHRTLLRVAAAYSYALGSLELVFVLCAGPEDSVLRSEAFSTWSWSCPRRYAPDRRPSDRMGLESHLRHPSLPRPQSPPCSPHRAQNLSGWTEALISLYTSAERIHTSKPIRLVGFASCQRNVLDVPFDCATMPIVFPKKESLKRPGVFCAKAYSFAVKPLIGCCAVPSN